MKSEQFGPSQITDARLDYIRFRDRSADDWKCLSVNPAVDGCLLCSVIGKNEAAKREKLAPYFICFVQDTLNL